MNRKFFFFDIDGTLAVGTPGRQYIPESTKKAIRMLKEQGHFVAIATGRSYAMAVDHMRSLGFGNMVNGDKIISMVSTDAAPIKRMIQNARDEGKAVDATCGRRTRAVLVMESGHLILSALTTDTLSSRCHSKRNDEDEENER